MQKYKTASDFSSEGVMPILDSIVTAIPPFFSILLFVIWIVGTVASYYAILFSTGKKRPFHSATAMSFVMFIASLVVASMNSSSLEYLSGYWVAFYILATLLSWYGLRNYK